MGKSLAETQAKAGSGFVTPDGRDSIQGVCGLVRCPLAGGVTPECGAPVFTRFGASKCVSERQSAFRSVKVRFGARKCVSEGQSAFRSVKVRFGASKCVSERQNAFRSKGVGGGPLRFECRIEI